MVPSSLAMLTLGVTPRGSTKTSLRMYWNVTSHGSPTVVPSGGGLSEMPVFPTAAAGSRASRAMAMASALMELLRRRCRLIYKPRRALVPSSARRARDSQRGALRHAGLDPHKYVAVAPDQRVARQPQSVRVHVAVRVPVDDLVRPPGDPHPRLAVHAHRLCRGARPEGLVEEPGRLVAPELGDEHSDVSLRRPGETGTRRVYEHHTPARRRRCQVDLVRGERRHEHREADVRTRGGQGGARAEPEIAADGPRPQCGQLWDAFYVNTAHAQPVENAVAHAWGCCEGGADHQRQRRESDRQNAARRQADRAATAHPLRHGSRDVGHRRGLPGAPPPLPRAPRAAPGPPPPPRSDRSRPSARDNRDLSVPARQPRTCAASASDRPRK